MKVTIDAPDMKDFIIMFQDLADVTKNFASEKIAAGATAANFLAGITEFYTQKTSPIGIAPTVVLHC